MRRDQHWLQQRRGIFVVDGKVPTSLHKLTSSHKLARCAVRHGGVITNKATSRSKLAFAWCLAPHRIVFGTVIFLVVGEGGEECAPIGQAIVCRTATQIAMTSMDNVIQGGGRRVKHMSPAQRAHLHAAAACHPHTSIGSRWKYIGFRLPTTVRKDKEHNGSWLLAPQYSVPMLHRNGI